jgi:hypothetical protein
MQSDKNPFSSCPEPGAAMADFLPIPAPNPVDGSSQDQESFDTSDNHPTFSHAVATEAQDDHGHVQQHPEKDVLNLGWNERKEAIAAPLIGGMDNEELWMLTRRFNKVGSFVGTSWCTVH